MDDEMSAMLASVTTSKTSSVGSVDDRNDISIASMDREELAGILPGADSELLAVVPRNVAGWETTERSPPMVAPESPLEAELAPRTKIVSSPPAASVDGGATKGVDWEVFVDRLDTDGAIRNGSKIIGLKEANKLLVWNSKLRDMKPVGFSTVRIAGTGPGRMPVQLQLCAKGQKEPVAVEKVRTVRAFSVSSFTGLKVERAAIDDGTSASSCDLRVALRIGPYGGNLTPGGEVAKGSAQKLGCDRACCFHFTSEIGFTAAQFKSTLGDDEWLIPHSFSATSPRNCSHTLPSSVRSALQGKAAKLEARQYPFYFVAVLEDTTRVLVEGSFRMQSGSDERMAAMTQQKRRWRKEDVKGSALGKRQSLASLDANELKQKQQQAAARAAAVASPAAASPAAVNKSEAGGVVYRCRCSRCGRPKKQAASSCPCSKTAPCSPLLSKQQLLIEESPLVVLSSRRPDYTTKCKHCSVPKKQPRSKCPCNGTGLHPQLMVAAGSPLDPQVTVERPGAGGKGDVSPTFRKMDLDDINMSQPQENEGPNGLQLNQSTDGLADMAEPGEADAIDMSDSSWNTLIPTDVEIESLGPR